jgi:hypothetical protein
MSSACYFKNTAMTSSMHSIAARNIKREHALCVCTVIVQRTHAYTYNSSSLTCDYTCCVTRTALVDMCISLSMQMLTYSMIDTCIACVLPLGCLLRLFNRRALLLLLLLLMPPTLLDTRLLFVQNTQSKHSAYKFMSATNSFSRTIIEQYNIIQSIRNT